MSPEAEPRFLDLPTVLWLHRRSLDRHGGLDGVRDPGAVEAALASVKNAYFYGGGDIHDIAAAYAYHIAESQAFLDGNKRTAAACALVFLIGCGCVDRSDDPALHAAMIAVARRELDKPGFAALLREQFPRA
jgi:death-on-curing protein